MAWLRPLFASVTIGVAAGLALCWPQILLTLLTFWKELEAAGVGSIIYGRKGKPNRFSWHYSLKSVAQSYFEFGESRHWEHLRNHIKLKTLYFK